MELFLFVIFILGVIQNSMFTSAAKVDMIHSSRFLQHHQHQQLLNELVRMDTARLNYLFSSLPMQSRSRSLLASPSSDEDAVSSNLVSASYVGLGQYFVDFQIGTPPQKVVLIMDTGSDLTWVKCSQTSNASSDQMFSSKSSSTFKTVSCTDNECNMVPAPPSSRCVLPGPQICDFSYSYSDASTTQGNLSRESITMDRKTKPARVFENVVFGAVSESDATSSSFQGSAGVFGLGRGPLAFPSQAHLDTFSYCLVDYLTTNASSSLSFGGRKNIQRKPLEYVPILRSNATFYYVGVTGVRVAGRKVHGINRVRAWHIDVNGNGGTIFDSGTTLTYLREPAYSKVMAKLSEKIKLPKVDSRPLEYCYNISNVAHPHKSMPELTIAFQHGAKFRVSPNNYMVLQQKDLECVAIAQVTSPQGFNVIGNLMQRNFHFEIDVKKSRIGFAWSPCS